MKKLFLNYDDRTDTVSVNTYQNNGWFNHDVKGLVADMAVKIPSCCNLEGALEAIRDGEVWVGTDATTEILEMIETAICEFEKN